MAMLPNSLLALVGRSRATETPAAEVAANRDTAAKAVTSAEFSVEAAEAAYQSGLVSADDAAVQSLDEARRDAAMRLDRARAVLSAVEASLAAAKAREHAATVEMVVKNADDAVAAFRRAVEIQLPIMSAAAREILKLRAHAEMANEAADAMLRDEAGEGAGRQRPPVESFRAWPGRPRRELSARIVERWTWANGEPLADEKDAEVRTLEDGTGRLATGTTSAKLTFRRRFRRVELLPEEPGRTPESLVTAFAVPGLTALDQPGWEPEGMKYAGPTNVLAAIKSLERHRDPEPDARQPQIKMLPVGEAWDVTDDARPEPRGAE